MVNVKLWTIWTGLESRRGERLTYEEVNKTTGLAIETLRRVKLGTAKRLDLNTLSRLCEYFDCGVGDLLEYVPESRIEVSAK